MTARLSFFDRELMIEKNHYFCVVILKENDIINAPFNSVLRHGN